MKVNKSMKNNNVWAMFLLLVLMFVMPKNLRSQIMEVGVTGGAPYYLGDLNPSKHFSNVRPSFGGMIRYYQNLRWAFRLQYSHYNLHVQPTQDIIDQIPKYKGKYKFPEVNDVALIAEFNYFDYWTGSNVDYWTPYVFLGLSGFNQRVNDTNDTNDKERGDDITNKKLAASIPFGFGVKYSLFGRLGLTLEWRMHKTLSDDLDNMVDKLDEFNFGYDNDWIGTLEMSFVYRFNLPNKCNCNGIRIR